MNEGDSASRRTHSHNSKNEGGNDSSGSTNDKANAHEQAAAAATSTAATAAAATAIERGGTCGSRSSIDGSASASASNGDRTRGDMRRQVLQQCQQRGRITFRTSLPPPLIYPLPPSSVPPLCHISPPSLSLY